MMDLVNQLFLLRGEQMDFVERMEPVAGFKSSNLKNNVNFFDNNFKIAYIIFVVFCIFAIIFTFFGLLFFYRKFNFLHLQFLIFLHFLLSKIRV